MLSVSVSDPVTVLHLEPLGYSRAHRTRGQLGEWNVDSGVNVITVGVAKHLNCFWVLSESRCVAHRLDESLRGRVSSDLRRK